MAGDHRQQLARLSIPPPFQVHHQHPLYSPAIQTAIHPRFPPQFPPPSVLQTPIQASFFPPPSPLPNRPIHQGHRAAQASIALAAAGIHPPHGPPITPLGHGQFPPAPFAAQQFPPFRNRRQPSVSIGGPPKAQLGGVGKNYRPPSPTLANAPTVPQKSNKAAVNLPKETVPDGDGPPTRSSFARTPIPQHLVPPQPPAPPPDVITAHIHPPDHLRVEVPNTIDVFLPGKSAWDEVKKKFIDEKLEKLGVEKGTGSSVPHIHAPHARAASISSPADPALLFFKLNKLQQAQNSQSHSASVSPQPPFQMFSNSPPPPPIIQPLPSIVTASSAPLRHGHSLSMAAAPFIPLRPYMTLNNSIPFNSFGPGTSLPPDTIRSPDARSDPGAPTDQSLAPPTMPARADSRPDFIRGFGLDVPEEAEEEQEETEPDEQEVTEVHDEEPVLLAEASHIAVTGADDTIDMELEEADDEVVNITTAAQSRVHSRHVSRLSAALSLRSVGGHMEHPEPEVEHDEQDEGESDPEDDAIGEWTGSEDLHTPTEFTEDDESIGEWSNPSDEERARQQRQQRRHMRRAHHQQQQDPIQVPRRIPNFPHPPPNPQPLTSLLSRPREIDEDMISNPSDDNFDRPRALPLPPSSRPPSSRLSVHDPIRVHSRAPSSKSNIVPTPFPMPISLPIQAPIPKRNEALNPHAKPFVFGGPARLSGSFSPGTFAPPQLHQQQQQQQQPPVTHVSQPPLAFGHTRGASLGKPLNAGAPEFRPNTFTFTPPPNVPKFPQPQPPSTPPPRPSPPPRATEDAEPIRAQQGREKRQRRSSVGSVAASDVSGDGRVVMTSFKFPQESPARKSAPPSPAQRQGALNAAARPFTLPGLGGINIGAINGAALRAESPVSDGEQDGDLDEDGDGDIEGNVDDEHELPMPLSMKARRAPIPLDFKHPVSTNTVPAGLFKALANGNNGNGSSNGNSNNPSIAGECEEHRTRRAVRSRLGSREIFEHASRPSLDDLLVPAISHKASRGRLITDPGQWDVPAAPLQEVSRPVRDRRASLPVMSSARSSFSDISVPPQDISRRLELQQYEERLEALLESKLDDFREEVRALRLEAGANGAAVGSSSTEAAINEVVSLFRAQLQESAARGLDDSQVDARGELDFQLVRDIVEQGHAEARAVIQQDLDRILRRVEALQSAEVTPINGGNTEAMLEEYHARTHNTVVSAMTPISERLDALERIRTRSPLQPPQATMIDHEALVRDLHAGLVPHIAATRAEPIDYDVLTEQLSQAVKPHISQLIDLASDKQETAGLIVDRLVPVLPKIFPPPGSNVDVPAVVAQIGAEIRRIVAPLDPHEMKEQVSGLVVERLDSRLATRDRVLDGLQNKLVDGFDHVLEPVKAVASCVAELSKGQEALSLQTRDLEAASRNATDLLSTMPELLAGATEPLRTTLADLISMGPTAGKGLPSPEDFLRIGSTVESLSTGQQALQDKASELLALHQDVLSRLIGLPDSMAASIEAAQLAHAELLSHTVTKEDFEEVRSMMMENSDLRVQLAKSRAQHGVVRAEKDIMLERMASAEAERDQLRTKVDEVQAVMLLRATDAVTSQARTMELEEALSQSLARLKTSDVTIESQQERLLELEKLNRELNADKQALVSKVHTLEAQAGFATRDKEAAVEALAALRKENDALVSQQDHWDDLRRTNEQLEQLAALVSQAQTNEPELKELRRARDRSKVLEGEYAALQRRHKEQETRVASSERTASAARASLAQAQQRAAEWEQMANENEAALEDAQAARDQAEDRAAQLEAEHSLVRMQLDEKDAEERLAKDRENKLRDQVAALEARVTRLQVDASWPKKTPTATTASSPPRPDSRTSTVYPSRAATPTAPAPASVNGRRADTPPQTSVYDSIHAPLNRKATVSRRSVFGSPTPTSRYDWSAATAARRVASPTPSVVSVAPTLGDDGWYE